MYVIPFVVGPLANPASGIGVQLTDSADVVIAMRKTLCVGDAAWKSFTDANPFTHLVHTSGQINQKDPCVYHFPEDNAVWSCTV